MYDSDVVSICSQIKYKEQCNSCNDNRATFKYVFCFNASNFIRLITYNCHVQFVRILAYLTL